MRRILIFTLSLLGIYGRVLSGEITLFDLDFFKRLTPYAVLEIDFRGIRREGETKLSF